MYTSLFEEVLIPLTITYLNNHATSTDLSLQ